MEAVIFIGIQASGKSTFYQECFSTTHLHINLDMLKTRRREDLILEACLLARQPFVIDNTNVLECERAKYISLAKPAGFRLVGYFFQSGLEDALRRNQRRAGKSAIPATALRAKHYHLQPPRFEEGFDRLFTVQIAGDGLFDVQEWVQPADKFPE